MTDVRLKPATQTRAPAPSTKAVVGGGIGAAALLALSLAVTAIKPDEGSHPATYLDLARVPTDCYGHTGADVGRVGTPHSLAQCDALLTADARRIETAVLACTPSLATRPQQLAASTRLAFNIGPNAYCHSGTASAFRRGDWRAGCDMMLAWDKARVGGWIVAVAGLAARRQRERAMCLVGVAA